MEDELGALGVDISLTTFLLVSIESGFNIGGCDMTTGCGTGAFDAFIIGLICVDPTFIVGADCCIVFPIVAVFNTFANFVFVFV